MSTLLFVAALMSPVALRAQAISGEQIRRQIQQSGLSAEQVRDRLAAAGYPEALLDSYLTNSDIQAPEPTSDILAALRALSVTGMAAEAVEPVNVDSGLVMRPLPDRVSQSSAADSELKIFGIGVFRGTTSQFQPLLAGPVPDSYRLGAGDLLVLVISGDVEIVHNLEVTRDGFILIPQVGQLYVSSLTMSQLRQALRQRLGLSYSGIRSGATRFDVTIGRLRTNQVYVVGEVVQPGAYQLASVATVLNALYAAGGPTESATLRSVSVQRSGTTIATLDLYDYLLRGSVASDITLEMGDVVFVGVHGVRASISGAVKRPAIYELAVGQTLQDLVDAAGGFRADAALRRISVSRIVPPALRGAGEPDRIVLDVPVEQVVNGEAPPIAVEPGDQVRIFEVPSAMRGYVDLHGAVYQPGTYGWRPGVRISEVVAMAGGLKPAVVSQLAHIDRLDRADSTRYLLRVSLPADSLAPWPNDIELHDYDIITIYGRDELREDRTVEVSGMVNHPGIFAYSEGMTARDLVLLAGGLKDGAFLDSIEIARLPDDRSGGRLAQTFRATLDSTYLFEPSDTRYRFLPGPPANAGGAPEVELLPFDRVTVLRQPDFEMQRMVRLEGEVIFPGSFALQTRQDRLSTLVLRAGGLTERAFLAGAILERAEDEIGPINIQLAAALEAPGSADDIILRPGDVLTVPEYNPVVRVEGAVTSPTSVLFKQGEPLRYYVESAGGYTRLADKSRVRVKYANGSAEITSRGLLLFRSQPEVRPGATIVVPAKEGEESFNPTQFFTAVAQIVASTATIIVVLTR
jgi:polysaccharide export outer membrane protein